MIKFTDARELLTSKQFVREPVVELSDTLKSLASKKIILYGGRGSGKTVVLNYLGQSSANTKEPVITTRFDSVGMFGDIDKNPGPEEYRIKIPYQEEYFITHYYEVLMAGTILSYINKYHGLLFDKHFSVESENKSILTCEIDKFIRASHYTPISLPKKLVAGEMVFPLIKKFKNLVDLETLTLAMDRFDWTDNRSFVAQNTLSKYFELFDKTIITADDEEVINGGEIGNLGNKGYSFVKTNYGKDFATVKKIVGLNIDNFNNNLPQKDRRFPLELLSDDILDWLTKKGGGNINIIQDTINYVNDDWQWFGRNPEHFEFAKSCAVAYVRVSNQKQKMKTLGQPPRLHL